MDPTIVVLHGDQTGEELLREALRVLDPEVIGLPPGEADVAAIEAEVTKHLGPRKKKAEEPKKPEEPKAPKK